MKALNQYEKRNRIFSSRAATILFLLVAIIVALPLTCPAQEANSIAAAGATHIPPNVKADLVKLFSDILDSVSFTGLGSAGFLAWVSARFLRKGIPDNLQNGILGAVLKHAALEINPQTKPQTPDAPAQTTKTTT